MVFFFFAREYGTNKLFSARLSKTLFVFSVVVGLLRSIHSTARDLAAEFS